MNDQQAFDTLDRTYRAIAMRLWARGFPCDDSPLGPVHRWVVRNVKHRPDTAFFIVVGVTCAMADLEAQSQGFESSVDRALHAVKQLQTERANNE